MSDLVRRARLIDPLRTDPEPPTEREQRFVEGMVGAFLSPIDAAVAAGFTNPQEEIARIFAKPAVMRLLVARFQAESVPWRALVAKAKNVLWRNMDEGKARDSSKAAEVVLATVRRTDGASLADSAAAEDEADRQSLVEEVLNIQREREANVH